ncbi:MAG: amino acid adenylation domain-containing protein, partial [Candidatus Aminicenantes bacterium]|nr:amino acid adenylation domain-containing protein [Candidatus Aminicenantes bacterium]
PYDRQPGAGKPGSKTGKSFTIPPEILSPLLKIVSGSDTRLHMFLAAAVITLLNKYNNDTRDIIIGVPVYKQEKEGKFINTVLTLRNELTPGMSFKELLLQVRRVLKEAVEHQNYPIETLLYNLDVPSLFDVAVLLENIHDRAYLAHIDLNMIFSFKREGEEVTGTVEYNAGLYEEATLERIQKHFIKLLQEALFNIDIPFERLDILSDEDKRQLLVEFNDSDMNYELHKTIDQLFAEQVEKNPETAAVVGINPEPGEVESLTYAQLNRRANRPAHLLRSKGVTPGTIVGLLLERTIDMAVAIMAVIKAGAAYLPITPDTPADRIDYLLKDSHAAVLVTHGGIALSETISLNHHILDLDKLSPALEKELETGPEPLSRPADPVYCIFTSGSTGLPKGVLIGHRNLHNLVIGLHERVYKKYEPALNVALISPYIFDASVKMIFAALLLGHTLHIVPEDTRVDGSLLLDYFENFKIEVCDGTPTHLKLLVESGIGNRKNLCLKQFLIGGESLSKVTLAEFFRGFTDAPPVVTNVYGPTECSVDATFLDISPGDIAQMKRISIGKPMPNHRVYILDTTAENRLQPIGVTGELCIAGHGVSAGYLNRPELTAETFVGVGARRAVPGHHSSFIIHNSDLLYRTGDLARRLADGNVEFVGRVDQQVKIRGYRLEPGEIENRLLKHEKIKEAIVVAKKDAGGDD